MRNIRIPQVFTLIRSFDEDMLKFWIKNKAAFNCLIIS